MINGNFDLIPVGLWLYIIPGYSSDSSFDLIACDRGVSHDLLVHKSMLTSDMVMKYSKVFMWNAAWENKKVHMIIIY